MIGRHTAKQPREPARWWADAVGTVAIASMVVVVALWLHDTGLQALTVSGTSAATSLGRLTGLLASDLLLIQVFLMARVPWVEGRFGQDRLTRWHRYTGFTSFWLMLGHIVLIVVGYAASGHTNVVSESWQLTTTYPGMLLAAAGTALLIGVVVLSIRAARRQLRYESWHLLHLYAYLGVGLALPHQLWTGTEFVASPAARAYWWSAYILCAGSVLVFRLGLPLWRSHRHRLRVRKVTWEAPGVFSIHISGRDLHRLPARAGQFLNWRFLTGTGWTRAHPYSLSAPPRGDLLRITVRANGDDADRVAGARPGTRVLIEGPYGRLTGRVRTQRQILLLGAGIGITPLRALLEELPYRPGEAALVYRANAPSDFALRSELDAIARHRGAQVHYLDGPSPARGSWLPASLAHLPDRDVLLRIAPNVVDRDVYLCGPPPWMDAVRTALQAAQVPSRQIHCEAFAW
ncbi:ferric reductase-like transmembrane domain-containing protein [Micromonospora sp. RHAY321]|uniref:ferredoxin reductase family protein n=1 Tax=Micromonospora sp. RHAY321 TaxID=2944807 RepID=UPI00207C1EA8|nr:ferric reductase-like transmembrane domain-containing protein [Micromonospora sp. RHAY321]MCO1593889.1 ferric reductase-like transmembrane domain-containing protein [Micromonospora sp. RHAY321]